MQHYKENNKLNILKTYIKSGFTYDQSRGRFTETQKKNKEDSTVLVYQTILEF